MKGRMKRLYAILAILVLLMAGCATPPPVYEPVAATATTVYKETHPPASTYIDADGTVRHMPYR
jgi:PBP1b-binding outer membrane lipoprotein LpoB